MGTAEKAGKGSPRPFASDRLVRFLAGTMLLLGVLSAGAGVAYAVNGATQAQATVTVTVEARPSSTLNVRTRGDSTAELPRHDGPDAGQIRLSTSAGKGTKWLEADMSSLKLKAWGSTVAEQLLSRADSAALGLGVGAVALLLRGLLLSIAEGEPFRRGNAARIAGIAGVTAGASLCMAITPGLAAGLVLDRVGLDGPGSPVTTSTAVNLPVVQLLVALLLLALAEAFRRGTELSRDVDGLV